VRTGAIRLLTGPGSGKSALKGEPIVRPPQRQDLVRAGADFRRVIDGRKTNQQPSLSQANDIASGIGINDLKATAALENIVRGVEIYIECTEAESFTIQRKLEQEFVLVEWYGADVEGQECKAIVAGIAVASSF